jgi:hypothetical protein
MHRATSGSYWGVVGHERGTPVEVEAFEGSTFSVIISGLGFQVSDFSSFGFRVSTINFQVSGFGHQVKGLLFTSCRGRSARQGGRSRFGFRVSVINFRVSTFAYQDPGIRFRVWV